MTPRVEISLRMLTESNATKTYCRWLNDPVVNRYLETRKATVAGLKNYIRTKNDDPNCLFLGIFVGRKHVGNIKLEPIDRKERIGVVGIMIGDKSSWGKGVGREAIRLLCGRSFDGLGLKKVMLGVMSENGPAIALYKKCGFRTVGVEKKAIDHNGKKFDRIMMELTKRRYAQTLR